MRLSLQKLSALVLAFIMLISLCPQIASAGKTMYYADEDFNGFSTGAPSGTNITLGGKAYISETNPSDMAVELSGNVSENSVFCSVPEIKKTISFCSI